MKKITRPIMWSSALLAGSIALPSQAAKLADMDVSLNGFLSAGMISSNNDRGEFLQTVGDEVKFNVDSLLGLRLTVQVDEIAEANQSQIHPGNL